MPKEEKRATFPDALMLNDGSSTTPQGSLVQATCMDLSTGPHSSPRGWDSVVCEHIGAAGEPASTRATFHGFRTVEVERALQMVIHGPVVYADDSYRYVAETREKGGWARILSMIFVKSRGYAAQKEYRFALRSIRPEVGEVVDVPVSGMLMDCLMPVRSPHQNRRRRCARMQFRDTGPTGHSAHAVETHGTIGSQLHR